MAFSESLTVRILGDSSGLRQELGSVLDQIEELQRRISEVSNAGQRIGNAFSRLSSAVRPLQQVGQLLDQISRKLQALSRQQVSIDVQPAMQALQQLMQMIQAVAAQLQALSVIGPAPGGLPGSPGPLSSTSPRGMASGGLVAGPSGIDRVPLRLTAGEFVMRRAAVQSIGQSVLDRLNRDPSAVIHLLGQGPSLPDRKHDAAQSGWSSLAQSAHPSRSIHARMPLQQHGGQSLDVATRLERINTGWAASRLADWRFELVKMRSRGPRQERPALATAGEDRLIRSLKIISPSVENSRSHDGDVSRVADVPHALAGLAERPFPFIQAGPTALPESFRPDVRPWPTTEEPRRAPFRSALTEQPAPPSSTTNHFGGITIQLRDAVEVDTLIRDLRHQGITLRNRRG